MSENILLTKKHLLICPDVNFTEFEYIKTNFCGIVFDGRIDPNYFTSDTIIYLCGDIKNIYEYIKCEIYKMMLVVKDFSTNYDINSKDYKIVGAGQIPINIHNTGVYFRNFFRKSEDYFNSINTEHQFQLLTESNKPGTALRKGIYLTRVEKGENDEIKFNLLRCSTNLNGPTENFRETDYEIVNKVNEISKHFFKEKTEFNHILAQIYENHVITSENKNKERKAKIKEHSDKTKDMSKYALMAFTTFYKDYSNNKFIDPKLKIKKSQTDPYDYCFNDISVLTKLRFRLKKMVLGYNERSDVEKDFSITLYPNSVFIMSLNTNRLYTHEIVPSILPIDKIPVRMGYVIRCSKSKAVFKDGQTYIDEDGKYIKLEKGTDEQFKELKQLYFKENITDEIINYGNIYFSMNDGDYRMPNL